MLRSRYHETLDYWHIKKGQDLAILVYENKPNGRVRVKEIVGKNDTKDEISGVILTAAATITLETDSRNDIANNDFVRFRGRDWRVERLQKRVLKGEQYRARPEEITIIELKGKA